MALERGKLTNVVRVGAAATVGIITVASSKKVYVKSILVHCPGTSVENGTGQIYFVPNGSTFSDMNKIFDVDVKSGETVLLEPSYPLVLDTTGDALFAGTGAYTGLAATHMNVIITGDKESLIHGPLKSSLARSAKKLLGVFRREDLDLRGQVDSTRFVPPKNHYTITPPGGSAVTYDARSEKFSTMTAGEYTMVVLPNSEPFPAPVVLIGGGGDGWDGQGGRSGGAGGRTSATATFKQGNTYKVIVGSSGPEPAPTRFGGPGQNQAPAGGFTGIFYNSVTFANSALIAGGGGGSGRGPENPLPVVEEVVVAPLVVAMVDHKPLLVLQLVLTEVSYKVLVDSVAVVAVATTVVVEVVTSVLMHLKVVVDQDTLEDTQSCQLLLHLRHKVATMVELFPHHLFSRLQLTDLVLLVVTVHQLPLGPITQVLVARVHMDTMVVSLSEIPHQVWKMPDQF